MNNFKIGDKIRVVTDYLKEPYEYGSIHTIEQIAEASNSKTHYVVDNGRMSFFDDEIEFVGISSIYEIHEIFNKAINEATRLGASGQQIEDYIYLLNKSFKQ